MQCILASDVAYKTYRNVKPEGQDSIVMKLLLRLRGENYMDQQKKKEEHELMQQVSWLRLLNHRQRAYLEEKMAKKEILDQADKHGFTFLTIQELDLDMDGVYQAVHKSFNTMLEDPQNQKGIVDHDMLKLANFLRSVQQDKMNMQKFLMELELKREALGLRAAKGAAAKPADIMQPPQLKQGGNDSLQQDLEADENFEDNVP